jgi:hypothetical protein
MKAVTTSLGEACGILYSSLLFAAHQPNTAEDDYIGQIFCILKFE